MIRVEDCDAIIVKSKHKEDFVSDLYTAVDIILDYPVDDIIGLENVTEVYLAIRKDNKLIKVAKMNNLQDRKWLFYDREEVQ